MEQRTNIATAVFLNRINRHRQTADDYARRVELLIGGDLSRARAVMNKKLAQGDNRYNSEVIFGPDGGDDYRWIYYFIRQRFPELERECWSRLPAGIQNNIIP